ncbi:MAG: STAUR_1299 family protein [Myxococcaceae bacterium]
MTAQDPRLEALLARAFHRARAADANAELEAVRLSSLEQSGAELLSYEVLVPEQEPIRYLVEALLPKLVYFLECRGAKLPRAPGVFAALFVGDGLYCLHASDLLDELMKLSGLSVEQLVERWGANSV